VRGGDLRFSTPAATHDYFDPHRGVFGPTQFWMGFYMNYLIRWRNKEQGVMEPDVASLPETPDEETYIFRIDQGARFWDRYPTEGGRLVVADDIRANYQRQIDAVDATGSEDGTFLGASSFRKTASMDVPDETTFVARTDGPDATWLGVPLRPFSWITSPEAIVEFGDRWRDEPSNVELSSGTGMFIPQTFDPDIGIDMIRNDGYWKMGVDGQPLPYYDTVTLSNLTDPTAVEAAYRGREIFVGGFPLSTVQAESVLNDFPDHGQGQIAFGFTIITGGANFNADYPGEDGLGNPWIDRRFTQAMHVAVDRYLMIDTVYLGSGKPSGMGETPWYNSYWAIPEEELLQTPGFRPDREADIAEARALFDASGYDRSRGLTLIAPDIWEGTYPGILETEVGMYREALDLDVNFDVVEQNFGAVSLQVGTGGSGDFFLSGNLQAQNFLGTGRTVAVGLNRSRFITSFNFQYIDPYFTPDGVSRGVSMYVQEIDSPFNVANFNTSSYGASVSFSYPLSEVSGLGFDIGINHTELNSGTGSVQEIVSSPKLFPGVDRYLISPANPNPSSGPVTDTVFGDVNDLSIEQLRANPDPGFIDLYGDSFDNLSVSGNWYHNTLNRGQLANDGTFHNLGVEVTLPGSDLQFARFSYSSQFYWPLNWERTWVLGLRSNIGYGIGYGNTKQMPFFNHYFAGGLNAAGVVRGFEENSLGPRSTAGARYLTETATALLKDESGNILLKPDGSAEGVEELLVYRTEPLLDAMGQPVLDGLGNPLPTLAVEDFFLHEDYDSFGGNILTAATLELLFPVPFVDEVSNQLRTSLFIDAGNVFSSHCTERQRVLQDCSDFDLGQLRYSVGLAVTYLSPFGPLTFYLAQPFGKDGDDTKSFDFTVGTGF